MFSDAEAAALYDLQNPWDGTRYPSDPFYDELVLTARHPQARAWESWNPSSAADVLDAGRGRRERPDYPHPPAADHQLQH